MKSCFIKHFHFFFPDTTVTIDTDTLLATIVMKNMTDMNVTGTIVTDITTMIDTILMIAPTIVTTDMNVILTVE